MRRITSTTLQPHFNQEELREILTASQNAYGRDDPREIDKVIVKAYNENPPDNSFKWPKPDLTLVAEIFINSEVKSADGLTEKYGIEKKEPEAILEGLFPDDPLVCLGKKLWKSVTMRLSVHTKGDLSKMQFIVPSAMSKPTGFNKEEKVSSRCLDNTGSRQFLVIEFDKVAFELQAANIHHLASIAPLILVISSGGKSLHAWFDCRDLSEDILKRFMVYAVRLYADPAMFIDRVTQTGPCDWLVWRLLLCG